MQRERRSPERRGAGGAGLGHRQSGGVFATEVQPPIGTIAVAILEHLQVADLQDESTNWHTLSKIYHRGGCTRLGGTFVWVHLLLMRQLNLVKKEELVGSLGLR